ncbi:MAG: hypothetical protein U1E78_09645 [Gammaproteobacteria bacterium]
MSQSQVTLSQPLVEALTELAACLKKSPEECAELAISFFMQTDTANNAIIAKERFDEKAKLVPITVDQDEEEVEYDLKFHPEALEEYESLDEEQQTLVVCALVSRLFEEEEASEEDIDFPEILVQETSNSQLILTHFPFGDLVYEVSDEAVSIFLVSFNEEDEDFDEDDEDEEDFEEEDLDETELEADLEEER